MECLQGSDEQTPCFVPLGERVGGASAGAAYAPQLAQRSVAAVRTLLESEDLICVSWDCQTSFRHLDDLMAPRPVRLIRMAGHIRPLALAHAHGAVC